jgi:hypothetical protein
MTVAPHAAGTDAGVKQRLVSVRSRRGSKKLPFNTQTHIATATGYHNGMRRRDSVPPRRQEVTAAGMPAPTLAGGVLQVAP